VSAPDTILYAVDADGIATLTLNRPDKHNAFTIPMVDRWAELLIQAEADPAVKVIVLTGAGRSFCAGGDLEEMKGFQSMDAQQKKDWLFRHVHNVIRNMERLDKPVIAAINGTARGAGLDFALMCDLRIAGQSTTLAESYINMGLIAGDGGTWFLPRLIGMARALELFWTGRVVKAEEAERIGLVNRVVPDDQLLPAVYELARQIAGQPQQAVRYFKRLLHQSATVPLTTHLDLISSHMAILEDSDDHRARVAAFLKK
jgi:enoyl-CoA hydratase/carnithine racemase